MDAEDVPVVPALRRLCRGASALVLAAVTMVFFGGWGLGVTVLRNLVPGTVEMKPMTAVALLFCAASLWLLLDGGVARGRRLAGYVCAAVPVLLGAAVLSEYLFGWRLGIDQLLFGHLIRHEALINHEAVTKYGRPAPMTAVNLILTGLALLSLDLRSRRGWNAAELLAVPTALIAATSVIGYIYTIPEFYGPASAAKMALNTSICFLLLAGGVMIARPRGRLASLATTDDPGGIMTRRLLPLAVALPILLGWARLAGVNAGLFSDRVGAWWLSAVTVLGLTVLITRVATQLSRYAAERGILEAELQRLASHDPLTGLLNRRQFNEEMTAAVATVNRHGHAYSLLNLDLDRMKRVNDELGHRAGDELLQAVAEIVRNRLRTTDRAARLGGDEFAVLLPDTDLEGAAVVAEGLRESIADRCPRSDDTFWTTVSIGVARFAGSGEGISEVMARADEAMYDSKRLGGDRVTLQLEPVRGTHPAAAPASVGPAVAAALGAVPQVLWGGSRTPGESQRGD
jgi:diguanylate cyclase (GGDEF)-like protein